MGAIVQFASQTNVVWCVCGVCARVRLHETQTERLRNKVFEFVGACECGCMRVTSGRERVRERKRERVRERARTKNY